MALVLDPRTGQYVVVPDDSRAATMQAQAQQPVTGPRGAMTPLQAPTPANAAPTMTPEQAYAQGLQLTPPATMDPDVPTVPGQTWPLQPLQVSAGTVPAGQEPVVGVRDAGALATVNQNIASALQDARPQQGILQPAQRGNYNMYNTNVAALPQAVGAGLNFGFGVNGAPTATQYLQNMAVQDRLNAADAERAAISREFMATQAGIGANSTIGEIAAARTRLAALAPVLGAQTQVQGQISNAVVGAQASAADAQSRLQAAQLGAQSDLASRLLAADITGQYGVAAARAKGQSAIDKVNLEAASPAGQKAAVEAALLQTRLNAIRAGVGAGQIDNTGVIAATRSGQESGVRYGTDPLTGEPTYRINPDGTITPIDPATLAAIRATRQVPQAQ